MSVPLVVLYAVLLYHWYESVPPSGDVAATVNVTDPCVETLKGAVTGCVVIVGSPADTGGLTITVATALVATAVFDPPSPLLVIVFVTIT
jgi:hypothetical protein